MTKVEFFSDNNGLYGFKIEGHSSDNCDDTEGKIVCSAVSSAAYMAANTVSEIIGDKCEIAVDDAFIEITVNDVSESSRAVLEGLRLHITELSKQYKKRIRIITEV